MTDKLAKNVTTPKPLHTHTSVTLLAITTMVVGLVFGVFIGTEMQMRHEKKNPTVVTRTVTVTRTPEPASCPVCPSMTFKLPGNRTPVGQPLFDQEAMRTAYDQALSHAKSERRSLLKEEIKEFWQEAAGDCSRATGDNVVRGWGKGVRGPGHWTLEKVWDE